jgi:hypothetical protein
VTDSRRACGASWRQLVSPETGNRQEIAMHPMFKELFIQTDADDLLAEKGRRRRMSGARRARSAMVIKTARSNGSTGRSGRPAGFAAR